MTNKSESSIDFNATSKISNSNDHYINSITFKRKRQGSEPALDPSELL
jgi:hypothetical protein